MPRGRLSRLLIQGGVVAFGGGVVVDSKTTSTAGAGAVLVGLVLRHVGIGTDGGGGSQEPPPGAVECDVLLTPNGYRVGSTAGLTLEQVIERCRNGVINYRPSGDANFGEHQRACCTLPDVASKFRSEGCGPDVVDCLPFRGPR